MLQRISRVSLVAGITAGRCKTCMVKVDGIIDQADAWLISNEELAEGYALICVGKPRSDLRVHA